MNEEKQSGVGVCMEHSGCKAKIEQLEKNDDDIFIRLRALEMAVWKAAGATGVITAVVIWGLERIK